MDIAIVGTGYVGLVTGACFAYLGHRVTCVDSDTEKITQLSRGEVPIYEPHLDKLLAEVREKGTLTFSSNSEAELKDRDVIVIAVGTPSLPTGSPDLRFLEAAARAIGRALGTSRRTVIVNKSTVPVGSGNLVEALVREGCMEADAAGAGQIAFTVVSNPEFLQEGSAIYNSLYPDRIVVGAEQSHGLGVMEQLYRPIIEQSFPAPAYLPRPAHLGHVPFLATGLTTAELIKYAANSFLALKISFANEIANISEFVGGTISQVMEGVGLDSRIGNRFLNAGIGWGGSCFGKDLQALTQTALEYGYRPQILEAAQEVNRCQRLVVIQKLQEKLLIMKGRTIGVLGLAFKPETDDLRDAPSLTIINRLVQLGARVRVYDPIAMKACAHQNPNLKIQYCDSVSALAEGADALVLVTEWNEFRGLDLSKLAARMNRPVLIDGRNLFDPATARMAGFDYCGIGLNQLSQNGLETPVVLQATA